jgi:hypothetical protein
VIDARHRPDGHQRVERVADGHAVAAAAQVGRDQAEAGIGRPEPVPQPTLAADAVDGQDGFGGRHKRLDGELAAGHLHCNDLMATRVL